MLINLCVLPLTRRSFRRELTWHLLYFLSVLINLNVKWEYEGGSFASLWNEVQLSIEVLDDVIRYVESKSNFFAVTQLEQALVFIWFGLEKLKDSSLVLCIDSSSLIVDCHHQLAHLRVEVQLWYHFWRIGRIYCVLNNIDSHLFKPVGVPYQVDRQGLIALFRGDILYDAVQLGHLSIMNQNLE